MNFSSEPLPDHPGSNSPRFRRRRSTSWRLSDQERQGISDQLLDQVSPSFDFFLFSLLSGFLIAIGLVLNSIPFLVAGSLAAPFMAPLIGLGLASAIGSGKLLGTSALGTLVGLALVFITGLVGGLIGGSLPGYAISPVWINQSFPWDLFLVGLVGVILAVHSLAGNSKLYPKIPSALVAFALYTQISAAGMSVALNRFDVFIRQMGQALLFFCFCVLLSAILFMLLGYRPKSRLALLILPLLLLVGGGLFIQMTPTRGLEPLFPRLPTAIPESEGVTTKLPTAGYTATLHPVARTSTLRPTPTRTATLHPTLTPTPEPTPRTGIVHVDGQKGARMRVGPGFSTQFIQMLENGSSVILLEGRELKDQVYWVKVQSNNGTIGWMVESFLELATPMLTPSATP